ncbi:hypothetical protein HGM15179_012511, partial [Zosterops borbonicus]
QDPELEYRDGEQNEAPITQEEMQCQTERGVHAASELTACSEFSPLSRMSSNFPFTWQCPT